jgi:hypothetical protein
MKRPHAGFMTVFELGVGVVWPIEARGWQLTTHCRTKPRFQAGRQYWRLHQAIIDWT